MSEEVKPLHMWQIQAQLTGTTRDGWESSRQAPTMIVGAKDEWAAVRAVSDLAWDMSAGDTFTKPRHTFATVARVNPRTGYVSAKVRWARVTYGYGVIWGVAADTYAEVKLNQEGEE